MADKTIPDRAIDIAIRYRRAFAIGGIIWFWAGVAVYARFIQLPEFLTMFKGPFFWASVGGNALWWGAINPAIDKRIAQQQEDAAKLENQSEQS